MNEKDTVPSVPERNIDKEKRTIKKKNSDEYIVTTQSVCVCVLTTNNNSEKQ